MTSHPFKSRNLPTAAQVTGAVLPASVTTHSEPGFEVLEAFKDFDGTVFEAGSIIVGELVGRGYSQTTGQFWNIIHSGSVKAVFSSAAKRKLAAIDVTTHSEVM